MGLGWLMRGEHRQGGGIPQYKHHEIETVTLIAGGEPASGRKWKKIADEVAATFLRKNWNLVYCGMGTGLAGNIATKVLKGGGKVTAVVVTNSLPPDLPDGAKTHKVSDFHNRRRKLFDLGDGALVLPGGSGTLSELTDLVAWKNAGLYKKPLVVYDPDRWFAPVANFYMEARRRRVSTCMPWAAASGPRRIVFMMQNELI